MKDSEKGGQYHEITTGFDNSDGHESSRLVSPNDPNASSDGSPMPRGVQWMIICQMALFYSIALVLIGAHWCMFMKLDGQPVETASIRQGLQGALSNFLALLAEMMLVAGASIAYSQILWRTFRQRFLSVATIDQLLTLVHSPWNLLRPRMLRNAGGKWLIGLACFLMPIASMFPPGALTVEFRNYVLPTELVNIPTMDISDFGDGSLRSFIKHSLFSSTSDLETRTVLPRLSALARAVLTTGEPVHFPNPCSGPCRYDLVMSGPRFKCKDAIKEPLFEPCSSLVFQAKDNAEQFQAKSNNHYMNWLKNNSFQVTWQTEESSKVPCNDTIRAMDCSMSLATYKFGISNELNGTRAITREILNDTEVWDNERPLQALYMYYFVDNDGNYSADFMDKDALRKNFTNTQAYLISRAVVRTLAGDVEKGKEGPDDNVTRYFAVRDTLAVGSPYVGLDDPYHPSVIFTGDQLQRYLEDVLLSSIALNSPTAPTWTTKNNITAIEGAQVYVFQDKDQFYAPYGACLLVTALIYVVGIWSLIQNGAPAGDGFLQLVASSGTSGTLNRLSRAYSYGPGSQSKQDIAKVKLKYGIARRDSPDKAALGFGTENEVL